MKMTISGCYCFKRSSTRHSQCLRIMKDSAEWQALRLLTKAMFKKQKHVKEILSRVKLDENGRVTRWSLYNAVTNYVSRWGSRLKPQVDTWLQNKAQKILKTPIAQLTEEMVKVDQKKRE